MYEDDYEPLLNGTEYGLETDDAERLKQALAAERSAELELQAAFIAARKPELEATPPAIATSLI